jgi:hypothetical protein
MELIVESESQPIDPMNMYWFYKIYCKDPNVTKSYIGRTTNFKGRIGCHKTKSKLSDQALYSFIRENGGWDNFNVDVLHKCVCNDSTATFIEYSLIKMNTNNLNSYIPCITDRNVYNKEKCKQHYAVKKECECGWIGSKMDWSHHLKSKKHRAFCIERFEKQIKVHDLDHQIGIENPDCLVIYDGMNSKEIVTIDGLNGCDESHV